MRNFLILDNNQAVVDTLVDLFEIKRGMVPVGVTTIDQAVSRLDQDTSLEAVLVDYRLGESRDGTWFLSYVKDNYPKIKRILMSADRPPNDWENVADVFLAKPVWDAEISAHL